VGSEFPVLVFEMEVGVDEFHFLPVIKVFRREMEVVKLKNPEP
jgi:hypothetical protein